MQPCPGGKHLTIIYSILSSAVPNQRSKLAMAACQMAKDIFETQQLGMREEIKTNQTKTDTKLEDLTERIEKT